MALRRLHVAKKRRTKTKTIPFYPSKATQAKRHISPSEQVRQSTALVHTSNRAFTSISMSF
jgi:hypothetical protein